MTAEKVFFKLVVFREKGKATAIRPHTSYLVLGSRQFPRHAAARWRVGCGWTLGPTRRPRGPPGRHSSSGGAVLPLGLGHRAGGGGFPRNPRAETRKEPEERPRAEWAEGGDLAGGEAVGSPAWHLPAAVGTGSWSRLWPAPAPRAAQAPLGPCPPRPVCLASLRPPSSPSLSLTSQEVGLSPAPPFSPESEQQLGWGVGGRGAGPTPLAVACPPRGAGGDEIAVTASP